MKNVAAAVLVVVVMLWPREGHPCACCAYPGQWSLTPTAVFTEDRSWFQDSLAEVRLLGTLESAEPGKGSEILTQSYRVEALFAAEDCRFLVGRGEAETPIATLTLRSGANCQEFKSDVGRRNQDGEVELYKEWRFVGALQSDSGNVPVAAGTVTLVLQGYGNNCVDVGDFEHWVLNFQVQRARRDKQTPLALERATAYGTVQVIPRR